MSNLIKLRREWRDSPPRKYWQFIVAKEENGEHMPVLCHRPSQPMTDDAAVNFARMQDTKDGTIVVGFRREDVGHMRPNFAILVGNDEVIHQSIPRITEAHRWLTKFF